MIIHCFFDITRDGYFFSKPVQRLVLLDWHLYKTIDLLFYTIAIYLLTRIAKNIEFYVIGIFIFRWGVNEYFWNIIDKNYNYKNEFMGLSAWNAAFFIIGGFLFPLISRSILNHLIKNKKGEFFENE